MQPTPRVIIFGGPNGAGKSTHADAILTALGMNTFVNADLIARGLVGRNTGTVAFAAGRIMLRRLDELVAARADFSFESTLSSRTVAPLLRRCKALGYKVSIYYFSVHSADIAVKRVARRVLMGGHSIPETDIRRRFVRSAANFFSLYSPLADEFSVYDNSVDNDARIIAIHSSGSLIVFDSDQWTHLQKIASPC